MSLSCTLKEILENKNTVCCLCLKKVEDPEDSRVFLHDEIYLGDYCTRVSRLKTIIVAEMVNCLFPVKEYLTTIVCKTCTKSTVEAYTFIENCGHAAQKLNTLIDSLNTGLDSVDQYNKKGHPYRVFLATYERCLESTPYFDKAESLPKSQDVPPPLARFKKLHGSKKYVCNLCGLVFKWKQSLLHHVQTSCKLQVCSCDGCGDNFTRECLIEHQKSCIPYINGNFENKQSNNGQKPKPPKKSYVCFQCGKSVRNLKIHMETHGDKRYVCPQCGKLYRKRDNFMWHVKNEICTRDPELNKPEVMYQCDVCYKKYCSEKGVRVHMKIHSDNKDDYFECEWCAKRFPNKSGLEMHKVKHTQEKLFECEICNGRFVTKHSLLYHTRIHTGEKPYPCKLCDAKFLNASRLKCHMRIYHLEPELQCKFCNKMFKLHNQLNRHKRRHFNVNSSLYLGKSRIKRQLKEEADQNLVSEISTLVKGAELDKEDLETTSDSESE